jgi:hypothetical protein
VKIHHHVEDLARDEVRLNGWEVEDRRRNLFGRRDRTIEWIQSLQLRNFGRIGGSKGARAEADFRMKAAPRL